MLRALLWLVVLPFVGGVAANVVAIRINAGGNDEPIGWIAPGVGVPVLVGVLVRWLASRSPAPTRPLRWGLAATAMTLVFCALPFVLYVLLCGDCW